MTHFALWKMAWRNIFRNPIRNTISSTTVMLGVAVLIVGESLVLGIDEMTIISSENNLTGHVLLRPLDYPKHGKDHPIDAKKTHIPNESLLASLHSNDVSAWTSRLWFGARYIHIAQNKSEIDSQDDYAETHIKVIAYQPATEDSVFNRANWKLNGLWPMAKDEIAIGSGLAKQFDIQLGDKARILARTRNGSQNASEYRISGIVSADNLKLDQNTAWMRYNDAGSLTQHKGAVSHISLRLQAGRNGADAWVENFRSDQWEAMTAKGEVAGFLALNRFRKRALNFITFIVMAIAATGMTNAIMMAAYERKGEVGAMRAMGLSKRGVLSLFMLEGITLGALASLLGGIIGALVSWKLATEGIDIGAQAGVLKELPFSTVIIGVFSLKAIGKAITFGIAVSVIASIYPALTMRQILPARALAESQ